MKKQAKKKTASKKVKKKLKTTLTPEDRILILRAINKSHKVMNTVLECGGAFTHDCHEVLSICHKLGEKLGFKKDNWHSDFK